MKKFIIVLAILSASRVVALDNDSCNMPHFNVKGMGYIAKLSTNGELLWYKLTEDVGSYASDLYFEKGNIVLNLTTSDACNFEGDFIPSIGDSNKPLSHYFTFGPDGKFISSRHPGTLYGYAVDRPQSLKLPHKRFFSLCVMQFEPKRYGFLDIPHNHCYDNAFIKDIYLHNKPDSTVKPQWMYLFNGLTDDLNFDVLMDSLGNYYICGMVSSDFSWPKKPYYFNPEVVDTFPNYYPITQDTLTGKPKDSSSAPPPLVLSSTKFSVHIFPNPSQGRFMLHIESGSDELLFIEVADMQGKMLWNEPVRMNVRKGENDFQLDMSPYAKGGYGVTIINRSNDVKYTGIIELL